MQQLGKVVQTVAQLAGWAMVFLQGDIRDPKVLD
jgi:hypothetical protein